MNHTATRALSLVAALGLAAMGCTKDDNKNPTETTGTASEALACAAPEGSVEEWDATKLYFEYQSTDNDTGIHGLLGMSGWRELCVYAPDGEQILAVKPQAGLKDHSMADFFFESREPEEDEKPQAELLAQFPAGDYEIRGVAFEGHGLQSTAWLTHNIPTPPVITYPQEDDVVDPANLVVTWDAVTETVAGEAVSISGYEIIVTDDRDEAEDPHGMSQPVTSIHVGPSTTSVTIPTEFLQPGVEYELEVIALEESGNQTITVVFFETP